MSRAGRRPRGNLSTSAGLARVLAAAASLVLAFIGLGDFRLRRERDDLRGRNTALASRLTSAQSDLVRKDLRVRVLESEEKTGAAIRPLSHRERGKRAG